MSKPGTSKTANIIQSKQDFLERLRSDPWSTFVDYYAASLSNNTRALQFIRDELNLTPEQATQQRIGFSDRTIGKLIPIKQTRPGREVREQLRTLGLLKPTGHETLRGYVTVPILGDKGQIIGIRGHKLDSLASGEAIIVVGQQSTTKQSPVTQSTTCELKTSPEPNSTTTSEDGLQVEDGQVTFTCDDRHYRIRGLEKNTSTCSLKVNLMASRDGLIHLDALDLVNSRSRISFIKAAASELHIDADTVKKDIGKLLLKLETLQSERIAELKQPQQVEVVLTPDEHTAALELLQSSNLLSRIDSDLQSCGYVGERTNKIASYLAAVSRLLGNPLAIVIQSSSSAGKTSLMDAILKMMPEEEQHRFSNLTSQSLYYLGRDSLRHKILAISEDQGLTEAAYALKLLQSEGGLRHASVGKDSAGQLATQQHIVDGPVQIFLTTTAVDIDEELINRCLVLTVDETRQQTAAIHACQQLAQTIQGKLAARHSEQLRCLHQNAQRLLRPIEVINPYADQLTFPNDKTRLRRDYGKYLTLIRSITLLHQYQRPLQTYEADGESIEYINVTPEDIAIANGMAGEILGRSLDELSPQTRNFLMHLHRFALDACKQQQVTLGQLRFTRRDIRQSIRWSDFQIQTHLRKLVDLEYLLVHRGCRGRSYVYELAYDGGGQEGQPFVMGLIDPSKLQPPTSIPTAKSMSTTGSSSTQEPSSSIELASSSRQVACK